MDYTSLEMTAEFEGLRTTAYQDSGGVWTIGYGHTQGVTPGQVCTVEQAEAWLRGDMRWAIATVTNALAVAHVSASQGTFNALCDFVFNVGSRAFLNSNFFRALTYGDIDGACSGVLLYCHDRTGRVLPGLQRRRRAEVNLIDPTYLTRHGLV